MAPPLTPDMADHLRRRRALALLAEIEHPSGTARYWTGIGLLRWSGYSWQGASKLGTITPIKHTSDLVIQEIRFQLAGVDPEEAAMLSDDVRNRAGRAWLAGIGRGNSVIDDPLLIVDSELDYQSLSAGDNGSVTIQITARTGFYTLDRALDECWTTEEHKLLYPDDTGLERISRLQNQELQWTPS